MVLSAPSQAAIVALALTTVVAAAQDGARPRGAASEKTPDAWERRIEQSFAPRGLARVERLGNRWALTVLCHGAHTTYLEPGLVDHVPLADRYVQARYHYVDVASAVACVRGPCPPASERRLVLERADALLPPPTELDVRNASDRCQPDSGVLR